MLGPADKSKELDRPINKPTDGKREATAWADDKGGCHMRIIEREDTR